MSVTPRGSTARVTASPRAGRGEPRSSSSRSGAPSTATLMSTWSPRKRRAVTTPEMGPAAATESASGRSTTVTVASAAGAALPADAHSPRDAALPAGRGTPRGRGTPHRQAAPRRVDETAAPRPRRHVAEAQETCHELGRRPRPQLLRRAVRLHPPAAQDDRAVGHAEGLLLVVRHVHHRDAQPLEDAAQLQRQPLAQCPVQRAHRLIEHQQPRRRCQRPRQRHPLLLAAGQSTDRTPLGPRQPHQLQHLGHPRPHPIGRPARHPQPEAHVAGHVAVREERVVLEHQPEAALVGRHIGQVPPVEAHRPRRSRLKPRDDPQQRCLAAAARSQQAQHLALRDDQVDVGQCHPRAIPDAHARELQQAHQKGCGPDPRKRSMTSTDAAVMAISRVLMAIAWLKLAPPGRLSRR